MNLDFMPSPSPEHPGLFIRDPYRYSDAMLVVPPLLVECLACFDGVQTELDLRARLVQLTGQLDLNGIVRGLVDTLSGAGFLEDEQFTNMRDERTREFASKEVREPAHAGSAYPADAGEMGQVMAEYMSGCEAASSGDLIGL